jgi:formylglycine-generating enzyme required for sulfatase activity
MNFVKAGTFAIALVCHATANSAVTFDWTTVGNPGNGGDLQVQGTFGAVAETYRICKYTVTNTQYGEFLNAVAATDTFELYNSNMGSNANGGITQSGVSGSFLYAVKPGQGNNPVTYVSFFDAMRFVNWLENGQPIGAQSIGTTETGVYTIGTGLSETRRPNARYFLPSENEWYKAAYHKNNGVTADYWDYPTKNDAIPYSDNPGSLNTPDNPNTGNFSKNDFVANGYDDGLAVTGTTTFNFDQNYVTDVGAYSQSPSPYGTYDQGGVVFEWNEAVIGLQRGERGGSWNVGVSWLAAASRLSVQPTNQNFDLGFRVAALVPEPNSMPMLALGGLTLFCGRSRRAAAMLTTCSRTA